MNVSNARFKKAHGCQPENKYPQSERLVGWGFYKLLKRAAKDKKILEFGRDRYVDAGTTYSACKFT